MPTPDTKVHGVGPWNEGLPYILVTPTTGGAAGDGTVNGILTANGYHDNVAGTGADNEAFGTNALISNTTGDYNTAMGQSALYTNTTGDYNTAMGQSALYTNTIGGYNSAMGQGALELNTTGSQNSAMGQNALQLNTTGSLNSATGQGALYANTTGGQNSAMGQGALELNTTGNQNSAMGQNALYANTTGGRNSAVGQGALQNYNNTTSANGNLVAVGYQAGDNYTGTEIGNIVIGAGVLGTVGESNVLRIGPNIYVPLLDSMAAGGLTPKRGIDDRTSVTAVDSAAITVYAVPTTTGKFRISATIVGRSGTITSGIYTIKYTVGGVVVTHTVSITAVDTDASYSAIVQPDASTNVTGQLTTLTGTSPNVDVTCLVEGIGSGT